MLLPRLGKDDYVIDENNASLYPLQDVSHHALKRGRSVG
jgi:hypothetical protein